MSSSIDDREFLGADHDEEEYGEVQRPGAYGPRHYAMKGEEVEVDPPGAAPAYMTDAAVIVRAEGNDGVHVGTVSDLWAVFATTSDGLALRAMTSPAADSRGSWHSAGWHVSVFEDMETAYTADYRTMKIRAGLDESLAVALSLAGCAGTPAEEYDRDWTPSDVVGFLEGLLSHDAEVLLRLLEDEEYGGPDPDEEYLATNLRVEASIRDDQFVLVLEDGDGNLLREFTVEVS